MTPDPITIQNKANEHLLSEEVFLEKLQDGLKLLGRLPLLNSAERLETGNCVNRQLVDILQEAEQLHASREKLSQLARNSSNGNDCRQPHIGLHDLVHLYSTDSNLVSNRSQQVSRIKKKIAQTVGLITATMRTLLVEQQVLDLTLAALGVEKSSERYNATGERIFSAPESTLEARA